MISSAANVKPESFPPTEQDAMFHMFQIYSQLQESNKVMEKLGVEIRRCLVGTSYDRSSTCAK